jgi:hypothetical protein
MLSTDLQLVLLDLILESGDFTAHFDGRLTVTSNFRRTWADQKYLGSDTGRINVRKRTLEQGICAICKVLVMTRQQRLYLNPSWRKEAWRGKIQVTKP